MSSPVPLGAKIAKNRQLKLIAAQSRHLAARFAGIFVAADVRTTRINNRHFESTVYYSLSELCTLRLASAIAESPREAVERVHGVALSLLNTTSDLRHMLQAVDSNVFTELNSTLRSMDAKAVVHLLRKPEDVGVNTTETSESLKFLATVTAEIPLTDSEDTEIPESRMEDGIRSGVAISRGSGICPRDAIKMGFALALAELDVHAVNELRCRESEACCFLQSVHRDAYRQDRGGTILSAFLSSSLSNSMEEKWWQPLFTETNAVKVEVSKDKKSSTLTVNVVDAVDNNMELPLPLFLPPLAFQRIVVRNDNGSMRLNYGSGLLWPDYYVASTVLIQLCALLNACITVSDKHRPIISDVASLQGISFPFIRNFYDIHNFLPIFVSHSVERGLFLLNSLVASHCVKLAESEGTVERDIPLINLEFVSSKVKGSIQDFSAKLKLIQSKDNITSKTYFNFVDHVVSLANKTPLQRRGDGHHRGNDNIKQVLLVNIWNRLAKASLTVTNNNRFYQEIFTWSPPALLYNKDHEKEGKQFISCLGQLFSTDAQVMELSSTGGSLPNMLTLTSTSLGVKELPLCHILGEIQESCKSLFYEMPSQTLSVIEDETSINPQRSVLYAAQEREKEQSSYYCPDIVLMIQEMRQKLHLSQKSFPTLEFFQRATHNVPQRLQELAMGHYGDVPVYTRVVAHWGPNLRVEAECDPKNVDNVCGFFDLDNSQIPESQHLKGPLRVLLTVVCRLYNRVFPNRTSFPLIPLNLPNKRRAIDFLLYSWFMASPQIRCFEIDTRAARLKAVEEAKTRGSPEVAEKILLNSVDNYIIRAMLFYDFCGQRVLFAETHASTVRDAIIRVNKLAVSLNIPSQDSFSFRPQVRRNTRGFKSPNWDFESEVSMLLGGLEDVTHSQARVCFVGVENLTLSSSVEGIIEVQVLSHKIRFPSAVTKERGIIPSLILACRKALRYAGSLSMGTGSTTITTSTITSEGDTLTEAKLRSAANATLLFPRDDFPLYSSRFYTPANLLGEVLQGVSSKYYCQYTVDTHTREVVCLLYVVALAGHKNAASESVSFPLGVGRGWNNKTAWNAAALNALQTNFPDVLRQVERHKGICELLRRPDILAGLNCHEGFTIMVKQNSSLDNVGSDDGFYCTVVPRKTTTDDDKNLNDAVTKSLVVYHAYSAVEAYIGAADALLDLIKKPKVQYEEEGTGSVAFTQWDPTVNYGKSVWHACCGALGVAFAGKVFLRFEGGREYDKIPDSERSMQVQLVVRTWTPIDNRAVDTSLFFLHEGRIRGYSGLIGSINENGQSGEQLLFASTRLLAEAIGKYTDHHTRRELRQVLKLLQRLNEDEQHCGRLNVKRRLESCVELTLGCQCRVVVRQASTGVKSVAEIGIWLPGRSKNTRVPIVLSVYSADSTDQALLGLENNIKRIIEPLWATMIQSCAV
ncbi:uncharacterized protein TM35_000202320 [Trypanosoma theileri]|uniref:Uncharacterized protein n=1 Tax=Trypanosoma theileri TaxID=67003 RepID=A0A1X0NTM0_9TRYP|nr:uncharacterized protein TM35_000202320 [Trypanosoma theileri]ORC87823.1 hypothetical protein TM35_000202320 [Trypanosoma theileri]